MHEGLQGLSVPEHVLDAREHDILNISGEPGRSLHFLRNLFLEAPEICSQGFMPTRKWGQRLHQNIPGMISPFP